MITISIILILGAVILAIYAATSPPRAILCLSVAVILVCLIEALDKIPIK